LRHIGVIGKEERCRAPVSARESACATAHVAKMLQNDETADLAIIGFR